MDKDTAPLTASSDTRRAENAPQPDDLHHQDLKAAALAAKPKPHHRRIGLLIGAVSFCVLLLAGPPGEMSPAAWHVVAVAVLMACLWASEAVPLAAAALIPVVAFPLLGVQPVREVAGAYAHPLIFLFIGGFFVARAMQRWNLHRRIALSIAVRAGAEPTRLIAGFMVATAFLSMWVSNTATTMMMLPIAASVISVIVQNSPHASEANATRFGLVTMLAIAYSASIGGIGTLVGTPPNALMAAFFEQEYGLEISFAAWMALALPLVLVLLPLTWVLLTRFVYPFDLGRSAEDAAHGQEEVQSQLAALGPVSSAEARVAIVFVAMATLWLVRPVLNDISWLSELSDPGIAIAGALALFLLPAGATIDPDPDSKPDPEEEWTRLLDWQHARQISWDVLLLFGGGLALAGAFSDTGLSATIGHGLGGLAWLPLLVFVLAVAALVVFLTGMISNTAAVAGLLPVIAAVANATGHSPLVLASAAVFSASCAFMLPVATPPNAIVFASGYVTVPQMIRAGFVLNLLSILIIAGLATWITPIIFPTAPA